MWGFGRGEFPSHDGRHSVPLGNGGRAEEDKWRIVCSGEEEEAAVSLRLVWDFTHPAQSGPCNMTYLAH